MLQHQVFKDSYHLEWRAVPLNLTGEPLVQLKVYVYPG